MWPAILIASGGCYALKLAGLSVPRRLLDGAKVQRAAALLPVALLAALIATSTFGAGRHLTLDARAGGLAVAAVAVWRRAPFLLVVALAAAATAALRIASGG
jgi:branched-subunit amino acid transport protein